ncbi:MAG TPA: hypothetical protein VGA00_04430 [Acidiferrobacterales bacterium]
MRVWLSGALVLLLGMAGSPPAKEPAVPASIQEVKAKHAPALMQLPGVVSVGIGRGPDGRPAIVVGLDRERPETLEQLPRSLDGHPVLSEVVGQPRAQ